MEKSKKKKRAQTTLERIVFGRKFGFYAPYTIEECAELLLARSERHPHAISVQKKLLVTVEKESADFYTFRLEMGVSYPYTEVLGTLSRAEDSTRVEGRGRIGLFMLSLIVLGAIVFIPLSIVMIAGGFPLALGIFPSAGIVVFVLFHAAERERLCKLTYKILGKDK